MNFKNSCQPSALSLQPSAKHKTLPLAELEALACALLSVLLTLFGSRITRHHAFGLQLRAEFSIEQHESTRNTQANRIGLPANSTAAHVGQDVDMGPPVGRN